MSCPSWCRGSHERTGLHVAEIGLVDLVVDPVQQPNPAIQLYDTRITPTDASRLAVDLLRAIELLDSQ